MLAHCVRVSRFLIHDLIQECHLPSCSSNTGSNGFTDTDAEIVVWQATTASVSEARLSFLTHSRVSGFIEDLSVLDNFPQEEIAVGEALAHLPGRAHDHVNRKIGLDAVQDLG